MVMTKPYGEVEGARGDFRFWELIPAMGIDENIFEEKYSLWPLECGIVKMVVETGAALAGRVFICGEVQASDKSPP